MRIGIDCRSLQEPEPSGVSAYTQETLRSLVRLPEAAKHTFVCFANGFGLQPETSLARRLREIANGPNVEWRMRRWPNKILTGSEMTLRRPGLEWMFGKVDRAFIPNLQFFSYTDRRIPYVLTVHDVSFERYPDCLDMKGRLRHALVHPRAAVHAARAIVAVSEYTKWDVQNVYGVSPDKIHVVYPGADAMNASASSGAAAKGIGPVSLRAHTECRPSRESVTGPYIAFVSTIEPRKNLETLLQAMQVVRKTHPDVQLVVVGRNGWKSKKVLQRMRQLPYVRYLGYSDEETKRAVIAHARAFVYPSVYEGFGFPPLEAQRLGVPVIAGAHSSLPEVVGESALLVDVLDVNSVARGIMHVLTDEPLRDHLKQTGIQNVQRFTWEKSARTLLHVLTHL